MQFHSQLLRPTLVATAVALAIGSTSAFAAQSIVRGTVGGAYFTPPTFSDTAGTASSTVASVYANAKVCFDLNDNGVCDSGEPATTTASDGSFQLSNRTGITPLVAEISTSSTNGGNPVTSANVFRVKAEQVQAATVSAALPAAVDITPLTTEVARIVEGDGKSFASAVAGLAGRLSVAQADVLKAPTKVTDTTELPQLLQETVVDAGRFELAKKFVDRGDSVGVLRGNFDCPAVASFDATNAGANCSASDLNAVAGIKDAQQYAMNLESIPRYDAIFVVIMENQSMSVLTSAKVPYMNKFLNDGTFFYNYFSTGNPSEPNYLALGGADDWGVTGDGSNPITGVRANLANALTSKGLTWRIYEESMLPGQSIDSDNSANSTIVGTDGRAYTSSRRAVKHHPFIYYKSARNAPEYVTSDRTFAAGGTDVNGNAIPYTGGGTTALTTPHAGSWTTALQTYANNNNVKSWWTNNTQTWNVDQLKLDLVSGDVGALNFVVPDQCDDMHDACNASGNAEGGGSNSPGTRGDYAVQSIVAKIKSSALWQNPNKRVAIVLTFDEGENEAHLSCCGWNAGVNVTATPLAQDANGNFVVTTNGTSNTYNNGNKGHGATLFGVINNQQDVGTAPHGHYDTDYYSHFSFVRTLQDMFGLSDPGKPGTYMNRSKYTESFINANATLLPEYTGSANLHYDSVRAMNHVYQFPAGVSRKGAANASNTSLITPPVSTGPDADQVNAWALK